MIFSVKASAQNSILDKYTLSENRGEVLLNWTIGQGNTCNGIDILRSTDSLNFIVIGDIEGICGDQEKSVSYSFTDKSPVRNSKNFYRLELGSVGSSEIISHYYVYIDEDGYSLRPNPVMNRSILYYSNNSNITHELSIFNLNGNLIRKNISNDDRMELNTEALESGLYLFTLKSINGSFSTTGKFIVLN